MREDELPQEPTSVTLDSWANVANALKWDRAKTVRKLEERGDVELSGRDLVDVRLRAIDACLREVDGRTEGELTLPRFAWWYVASALHGMIKRNEYLIARNERADVYDELYAEYVQLHDYFGRGGNSVMHRLRAIRDRAYFSRTGSGA